VSQPMGTLHATTGDVRAAAMTNTYWLVNPATAKASLTGYTNLNPIADGSGTNLFVDFESVACVSDEPAYLGRGSRQHLAQGFH